MMDRKLLNSFCATCDLRPVLREPWCDLSWIYATDGRVMVRVAFDPALTLDVAVKYPPEVPLMNGRFDWDHDQVPADGWIEIPELPPVQMEDCVWCGGEGADLTCGLCGGYEDSCEACGGTGKLKKDPSMPACEECDGSGKHDAAQWDQVPIGESKFATGYLRKLKTLPQVMIEAKPLDPGDPHHLPPMRVKFEGGLGYLMPVKRD